MEAEEGDWRFLLRGEGERAKLGESRRRSSITILAARRNNSSDNINISRYSRTAAPRSTSRRRGSSGARWGPVSTKTQVSHTCMADFCWVNVSLHGHFFMELDSEHTFLFFQGTAYSTYLAKSAETAARESTTGSTPATVSKMTVSFITAAILPQTLRLHLLKKYISSTYCCLHTRSRTHPTKIHHFEAHYRRMNKSHTESHLLRHQWQ